MLPASVPNSFLSSHLNTPEEDDETMSAAQRGATATHNKRGPASPPDAPGPLPERHASTGESLSSRQRLALPQPGPSYCSSQLGYVHPTPFNSRAEGAWLHPSFTSSWSGYPNSLPSCLNREEASSCCGDSSLSRFLSLPGSDSTCPSSLEQPLSLHSDPPTRHHSVSPYWYLPPGAACCAQCPAGTFSRGGHPRSQVQRVFSPNCPGDRRLPGAGFTQANHSAPVQGKHAPFSTPLSFEQRRVFVTYEADNDKHVNEIINFVALLRHNGFDTHIDIFEQQFRSISQIDFMERYLSEKEYLIIIIISPKYYETVTTSHVGLENDERTCNTVYIHKQLQSEFIQNGSKNFRFIPILFPGAKKGHVPTWLQNTHVYGWPRDRDDILRRLMRVEKYNPPPIGELPTIVSIPI